MSSDEHKEKIGEKTPIVVALLGNVDVGKSTITGVLTTGKPDDGKGLARADIFKHPHEKDSGRTSDVSLVSNTFGDNMVTFADLAGHERYFKTTIYGVTSMIPDYGLVLIDKESRITKSTKEHIGILDKMKIPFAIVLTKIDMHSEKIKKEAVDKIRTILKVINRQIYAIKTEKDLDIVYHGLYTDSQKMVPIFQVSNITLEGIPLLQKTLAKLQSLSSSRPQKFIVDRVYAVQYTGTVVCGFNGGDNIVQGDILHMHSRKGFEKVLVKSIHNDYREQIGTLPTGVRGCLNIKAISSRFDIKCGTALSHELYQVHKRFKAKIKILTSNHTSVKKNYSAHIHAGCIRECIKVISIEEAKGPGIEKLPVWEEVCLRGNCVAVVTCEFIRNSYYLEVGQFFFFREGNVIGEGIVSELID